MNTDTENQATRTAAEIMNHYNLMIKPALEEENFIGIQAVAQTDLMSLESSVMSQELSLQVHTSLKMGLMYLVGLSNEVSQNPSIQQNIINGTMDSVERYFSEAELGLNSSPAYKETRVKE